MKSLRWTLPIILLFGTNPTHGSRGDSDSQRDEETSKSKSTAQDLPSALKKTSAVEEGGRIGDHDEVEVGPITKVEPAEKATTKPLVATRTRIEKAGIDILAGPWFDEGVVPANPRLLDLRNVQIHLKFGLVEFGNIHEFAIAHQLIERVDQDLQQNRLTTGLKLNKWVDSLRTETEGFKRSCQATLFGNYPLIRGFQLRTKEDEDDSRILTYTNASDAKRTAVRIALEKLAQLAPADPQHVLVLTPHAEVDSLDHNELEQHANTESHVAFARFPQLKLYGGKARESVDAMPAWEAEDLAFDPICREFLRQIDPVDEPRSVLIVQIRAFHDQNLHWVQAQLRSFGASALDKAKKDPDKLEADKIRVSESLTRDFAVYYGSIWTLLSVLYVLSLLTHGFLTISRTSLGEARWIAWLAIPSFAYFVGFFLTQPIMTALEQWLPSPRSSPLGGTWWPCIAGAIGLILPVGVFRLAAGSIDSIWPSLSYHGRWGIAFLPVAFGIASAWVHPAFQALGWGAILFIIAFAAAAGALVYCFGRAIDRADRFPMSLISISIALSIGIGAAAFMGSHWGLWVVASLAYLTLFAQGHTDRQNRGAFSNHSIAGSSNDSMDSQPPMTLEELRKALPAPVYQWPKKVETLAKQLTGPSQAKVRWIGLTGSKASGKSAALSNIEEALRISEPECRLLIGVCTHASHRDVIYQPFRDAFVTLGLPEGLVEAHSFADNVSNVFDNLGYELIPFWTFFSFDAEGENEKTNRTDLMVAAANALRAQSKLQPVILVIDDVQWIDEDSVALLRYLWTAFPPESDGRMLFLVAGRDLGTLGEINTKLEVITLSLPSEAEQTRVLTKSLNIEAESAKHIVGALGVLGQEPGGMYWILRAIRELVDDNSLIFTPGGFMITPGLLETGQLPVPHKMRDRLINALRGAGDSLRILECAALLGSRFRVSYVAECLDLDRLSLLETLRRLDRDSQLVRDVPGDQDSYEFSSTFLHEVIKEELGVVRTKSRKTAGPTKIARELHRKIAEMFQGHMPQSHRIIYLVAEHFCEAGDYYKLQALEACRRAVESALREGDEESAERFGRIIAKSQLRIREVNSKGVASETTTQDAISIRD